MNFQKGDRVVIRDCPQTDFHGEQGKHGTIEGFHSLWNEIAFVRLDRQAFQPYLNGIRRDYLRPEKEEK